MELEHLSFTADITSPHAGDAPKDAPFSAQHLSKLDWLMQLHQAPSTQLVFSSNGKADSLISHADLSADHLVRQAARPPGTSTYPACVHYMLCYI